MSDRYIPGVPCWIDTAHPDPAAAASFYRDLFGWDVEDVMPPDAPGSYFMATLRGENVAAISGQMEGAPPMATWNSYIWVDDADATAAKVHEAGGTVLADPFDVEEAGRMAVVADRDGAVFGWEILPLGSAPMWMVPGYGDLLERLNPGTRENMKSVGAPEGFEDV